MNFCPYCKKPTIRTIRANTTYHECRQDSEHIFSFHKNNYYYLEYFTANHSNLVYISRNDNDYIWSYYFGNDDVKTITLNPKPFTCEQMYQVSLDILQKVLNMKAFW